MVSEGERVSYLEDKLISCVEELDSLSEQMTVLQSYLEKQFGLDFLAYAAEHFTLQKKKATEKNVQQKIKLSVFDQTRSQKTRLRRFVSGDLSNGEKLPAEEPESSCDSKNKIDPKAELNDVKPEINVQESDNYELNEESVQRGNESDSEHSFTGGELETCVKSEDVDMGQEEEDFCYALYPNSQVAEVLNSTGNGSSMSLKANASEPEFISSGLSNNLHTITSVQNPTDSKRARPRIRILVKRNYLPKSKTQNPDVKIKSKTSKPQNSKTSNNESEEEIEENPIDDKPQNKIETKVSVNLKQFYRRSPGRSLFQCKICHRKIRGGMDKFRRHYQTVHSEEKPYDCPLCDLKFSRKDAMQRHFKRIHLKLKTK